MGIDPSDALARAYSRLVALRDSLQAMTVELAAKSYVDEFHGALDRLEEAGFDVAEFRYPDSAIKTSGTSSYIGGSLRGPVHYWAERHLLLAKVAAVVGYFQLSTSDPKRPLGFRPSS